MPTYEYACKSCDNQWEEVQKISEPSTKICPKCSKETAQRQISGGSFILKGGGWYADAYSSVKPAAKSGGSDSGTKTETKSSEKKDAAPAAKEASKPSTPPASTSSGSSGSSSGSSSKD
jgi:putative FmdB family regulatory protein